MTGRSHHEVPRTKLHLLAVVHDDLHPAGDEVAHMGGLAAVGVGDGLDVLGPLPTGLERRPANWPALQVHEFEFAHPLLERPGLLGRIKALADHSCHSCSPVLRAPPCRPRAGWSPAVRRGSERRAVGRAGKQVAWITSSTNSRPATTRRTDDAIPQLA